MSVIIVATVTISKSFTKYLNTLLEEYEVNKLQKTAMLSTARVLQKVLMKSAKHATLHIL
jgi:hypothetical protein